MKIAVSLILLWTGLALLASKQNMMAIKVMEYYKTPSYAVI